MVTATDCKIDVVCQGSPREMGLAQGTAAAERIRAARRTLHELEAFRVQQPWWMPYAAFRRAAEKRSSAALVKSLVEHDPAMLSRLQGLAEGSRQSLETLCLFNSLEALLSTVRQNTVTPGLCACSAVGVRGGRSAGGEPLIARNFDYLPLVQPYYFLRESRPQGAYRSLEFTTAPMAGTIDGINEHGLTITFNYAFVRDVPECAMPISMAITDALATCRTVSEATARIEKRPRWGAGILLLADAEGDLASLELSNTRSELRRPVGGADFVFHTNHFQTRSMREVEVPAEAIFSNKAPAPLRGQRVLESAEHRSRRFEHLLAEHRPLSADDLADLMADHGDADAADHRSLCMHSEYWNTTACLQFFPRGRRMRVSYSSACDAKYTDFSL